MLGNDSIHAGLTYTAEEVADVAEPIDEAVLVLYVQHEQKRAMQEVRNCQASVGQARLTACGADPWGRRCMPDVRRLPMRAHRHVRKEDCALGRD
jgi:hypothetical protein